MTPQKRQLFVPAVEYPDDIFTQTTPDESQDLSDGPLFNTLTKGWRTRSEIYERILPDGETSSLRINGPAFGGSFMTYRSDGGIRIGTGPLNTETAGSSVLGLYSEGGTNQKHLSASYYEYNMGGTEGEGVALSIKAYGDIIEECEGGQHSIKATKILITATDQLEIDGQNIIIAAQGDLQLQGASVTTATINEKDIVTGQKMTFGAGEDTKMQFDPRAQVNIISPGNINHKVLGDYKLASLGCVSLFALGGAGTLVKNRAVGMSVSTKTKFAAGGTSATDLVSTGFTTVKGTAGVKIDSVAGIEIGADANVDITSVGNTSIVSGGLTEVDSTGVVDIKGTTVNIDGTTAVKITGALIYLN
tara:strand:+ start:468 stop:1550 length:1083 start_codon:yes stop_codon:yes gene_type:complete